MAEVIVDPLEPVDVEHHQRVARQDPRHRDIQCPPVRDSGERIEVNRSAQLLAVEVASGDVLRGRKLAREPTDHQRRCVNRDRARKLGARVEKRGEPARHIVLTRQQPAQHLGSDHADGDRDDGVNGAAIDVADCQRHGRQGDHGNRGPGRQRHADVQIRQHEERQMVTHRAWRERARGGDVQLRGHHEQERHPPRPTPPRQPRERTAHDERSDSDHRER